MADAPILTSLSLCAGGAGLDLGIGLALDAEIRVACWVEWEAFAVEFLASQMEAGVLDAAPIWTDVRTFRGTPWRGAVDLVTAGFPCQSFSQAGARRGTEDARHLWPYIHRIVAEVRPRLVFLENVPGLISTLTLHHRRDLCNHFRALDAAAEAAPSARERWYLARHRERLYGRLLREHGISVLHFICCELETLGYRTAATLVTAAEVGASHQRERVFILGVANIEGSDGGVPVQWGGSREARPESGGSGPSVAHPARDGATRSGGSAAPERPPLDAERESSAGCRAVAHGECQGLEGGDGREVRPRREGPAAERGGEDLADTERCRRRTGERDPDAGPDEPDTAWSLPLFPPGPADLDAWRAILAVRPDLAPALEHTGRERHQRRERPRQLGAAEGTTHSETPERQRDGDPSGDPGAAGDGEEAPQLAVRGVASRLVVADWPRRDMLRLLGNGAVPLAAAYAFALLAARLLGGEK